MALRYHCGANGWWPISFARESLGSDVYLCCPGPSLWDINPDSLQMPGAYLAVLNTAYPFVRPHIWFGMDQAECYERDVWLQSFIKICRHHHAQESVAEREIKEFPHVYWATLQDGVNIEYIYSLIATYVVINVADIDQALSLLESQPVALVSQEEIARI